MVRLRHQLTQLVAIAVASGSDRQSAYVSTLVQRSQTLHAEGLLDGYEQGVLRLRQMAWAVGELFDCLAVGRDVKEAT